MRARETPDVAQEGGCLSLMRCRIEQDISHGAPRGTPSGRDISAALAPFQWAQARRGLLSAEERAEGIVGDQRAEQHSAPGYSALGRTGSPKPAIPRIAR